MTDGTSAPRPGLHKRAQDARAGERFRRDAAERRRRGWKLLALVTLGPTAVFLVLYLLLDLVQAETLMFVLVAIVFVVSVCASLRRRK